MAKIVVFDSGLGSISIIKEIKKIMKTDIVYFADQKNYPYGNKSQAQIASIIKKTINMLEKKFTPDVIVVASNTPSLMLNLQTGKIIDVKPPLKLAQKKSKSKKIGILATKASVNSKGLENYVKENNIPKSYKIFKINGSNLCNEIHLPTNEDRTAVCCLSSLNLEKYDEWKDTSLVKDLIRYLDNVLQFFIDHAGDEISRARYSAQQERSLGLGAMGFHSYLQQHRIAFESVESMRVNETIFKQIKDQSVEESETLAKERGECPDMEGTGRRNAHLLAIAPNANSSMIVSCSPSIEPHKANAYTHRTRAGSHLIKNRYLEEELIKLNMDKPEIWTSIITNGGSVQQLEFLSEETKNIFKTAIEINQNVIVELAGNRQKYLCQGQSLNVFFPAGASKRYLHEVHFKAWKNECKGLYYLRTETSNRAENVAEKIELNKLTDLTDIAKEEDECVACQG